MKPLFYSINCDIIHNISMELSLKTKYYVNFDNDFNIESGHFCLGIEDIDDFNKFKKSFTNIILEKLIRFIFNKYNIDISKFEVYFEWLLYEDELNKGFVWIKIK